MGNCPETCAYMNHCLMLIFLEKTATDLYSTLYKLTTIVDIGHHMLFKPITIHEDEKGNASYLPLSSPCYNKGLDVTNLGNILHHKNVKCMVPPYYKDHSVPVIT